MKHKIKLIGLLLLASITLNAQTPYFYYYNGEKQYLELNTEHIFISIPNENINERVFSSMKHEPLRSDIPKGKLSRTKQTKRFWTTLSFENKLSDEMYLAKLNEIKNTEKDLIVAPYFKTKNKDKIGLSNFFFVKLKALNDTAILKREAEKENAIIMWQNEFMPLWFALSVTSNAKYNSMELANRFYESGLFQCAAPDFINVVQPGCVNDPAFSQQWNLKNTGQNGGIPEIDIRACEAWQIATGQNITVAVLDQGISLKHPDLELLR